MIDASVLVVGGGAIGGVTAAKLTGAVRRVVVLDASEEPRASRAHRVDVIDGAVVEKGRECCIPTPLRERVTELIHAAERGERGPSPDALAELERL